MTNFQITCYAIASLAVAYTGIIPGNLCFQIGKVEGPNVNIPLRKSFFIIAAVFFSIAVGSMFYNR